VFFLAKQVTLEDRTRLLLAEDPYCPVKIKSISKDLIYYALPAQVVASMEKEHVLRYLQQVVQVLTMEGKFTWTSKADLDRKGDRGSNKICLLFQGGFEMVFTLPPPFWTIQKKKKEGESESDSDADDEEEEEEESSSKKKENLPTVKLDVVKEKMEELIKDDGKFWGMTQEDLWKAVGGKLSKPDWSSLKKLQRFSYIRLTDASEELQAKVAKAGSKALWVFAPWEARHDEAAKKMQEKKDLKKKASSAKEEEDSSKEDA
jgi:hypothetical protein